MKKHLITLIFPVIVALSCSSFAVWANEQSAAQPGCDKCAKMQKAKPCGGCDMVAKETAVSGEAKAAGAAPCEQCAIAGKTGQCAKCAKAGKDAAGCEKCAKQAAEGKVAGKQCEKCIKAKQAEGKPCCDKGKAGDK
jgi:hypothetical protein